MSGRTDEVWIRIQAPEGDEGMAQAIAIAHGHGGILVAEWDYRNPELTGGWLILPMQADAGIGAMMAAIEAGLVPMSEAMEAQLHAAPATVQ